MNKYLVEEKENRRNRNEYETLTDALHGMALNEKSTKEYIISEYQGGWFINMFLVEINENGTTVFKTW